MSFFDELKLLELNKFVFPIYSITHSTSDCSPVHDENCFRVALAFRFVRRKLLKIHKAK